MRHRSRQLMAALVVATLLAAMPAQAQTSSTTLNAGYLQISLRYFCDGGITVMPVWGVQNLNDQANQFQVWLGQTQIASADLAPAGQEGSFVEQHHAATAGTFRVTTDHGATPVGDLTFKTTGIQCTNGVPDLVLGIGLRYRCVNGVATPVWRVKNTAGDKATTYLVETIPAGTTVASGFLAPGEEAEGQHNEEAGRWKFSTAGPNGLRFVGEAGYDARHIACPAVNIPPRVEATTPANGAVNVSLNQLLIFYFNEELDPFSVNDSTISVTNSAGQRIGGTVAYDPFLAAILWGGAFAEGTVYTATLTTGIADASGVHMLEPYHLSFTTTADATPPQVLATTPPEGAEGVPINATVTITFSELLAPESVNFGTVVLVDAEAEQLVRVFIIHYMDTGVVRLIPEEPMKHHTKYVVAVTGVTDLAGNRPPTFRLRFMTASEQRVLLPIVRR